MELSGFLFSLVERSESLKNLFTRGGIKLKWSVVVAAVVVVIVAFISSVYILMATAALLSANDKLCQTIAGNIASAESFITVEKKVLKRSLILQDMVSGLTRSDIPGLVHAAVYDLKGMLSERRFSYAAHSVSTLRGTAVPRKTIRELLEVRETEKVKTILKVKGEDEACYRYRIPFKFFDARVGVVELVFTEKSILGPVNRAALLIVLLGIFMLSVGIAIAVKSAASMVRPVTYLTEGVGRVSGGDLDVQIEVLSHDEIGTLTREFNEMINHLREKLQMQKFVSKSTVSMIKEKTKMGDIGLGGTRENLAFLFSDVRGFTAMSEKLKPEEVVSILNEYLDLQAEIIKRFEGDIDKFVGDEVMAVFSGGRRADNAISAAVEIVNAIRDLNRKKSRQGQHIAEVGIGLNIGEVVSGRIGSRDRMDNTSIGDTVNLAARLCSYAEAGAIIASKEIVARASRKKFTGKKLDPIRVKGKAEAIEVFQITGMAQ